MSGLSSDAGEGGSAGEPLATLGLVGDGDELDALRLLEKRLKVRFDLSSGAKWVTVGDVYRDAVALAPEPLSHRRTWITLCVAFCFYQDDEPRRVRPETVLIGGGVSIWTYMRQSLGMIRDKWL